MPNILPGCGILCIGNDVIGVLMMRYGRGPSPSTRMWATGPDAWLIARELDVTVQVIHDWRLLRT